MILKMGLLKISSVPFCVFERVVSLKKIIGKILIAVLAVIIMTCCVACSGTKNTTDSYKADSSYSSKADSEDSDKSESAVSDEKTIEAAPSEDKLVYHASLDVETTEYKNMMEHIYSVMDKYKALTESQTETDNATNWYYSDYRKTMGTLSSSLVVRVPSSDFYDFIDEIEGPGKVVSKSLNVENISTEYHNNEARIEALETQQARLLEMLDNAKSIDEMLTIENRLTTVESQLNSLKTNKASMDSQVTYSTVKISIREVVEYGKEIEPEKTETFWDRLVNTFKETWAFTLKALEWLLFFLIRMLPLLVFFGIIAYVVVISVKHYRKKNSKKIDKKPVYSQASNIPNTSNVYKAGNRYNGPNGPDGQTFVPTQAAMKPAEKGDVDKK